jgi:hypothetical protein
MAPNAADPLPPGEAGDGKEIAFAPAVHLHCIPANPSEIDRLSIDAAICD